MEKKNKLFQRILSCCLAALMVCGLAVVSPVGAAHVQAEETVCFNDELSSPWTVAPMEDDNMTGEAYMYIDAVANGAKVKKLKSSNKKVARVIADSTGIYITWGVRTGSTKISCEVNGVKLSRTFKVKYTCPVSSFKVNGKSALSTFKKKNVFVTKKTLKNKSVKIKAKKGWVITKAETYVTKGMGNQVCKEKKIKNKTSYSAKISTRYPYDGICITFKNKKTGMEQTLTYRKTYNSRYAQAG